MKNIDKTKAFKLLLGLFLCALSNSFELHCGLGLSSWGVFHQGLSRLLHISFGQASIVCSLIILLFSGANGLRIGLGTVLNMLLIGWMVDLFDAFCLVPDAAALPQGMMMLWLSMLFNAFGSCLYIGCALGCGPRDGLMSVLTKKTGKPVGLVRTVIEVGVLLIGMLLGGHAGIGTVLIALFIGTVVQFVYKVMDFDITSVQHQTIGRRTAKG